MDPGPTRPWRPTRKQLAAAQDKTVPDVIAPRLKVLFCGINPGLYSAAVGHHFARPGNRFWPTLHAAGFTDRLLSPFEERELLQHGYGITNIVDRATGSADELASEELIEGGRRLKKKALRYRPGAIAFVGMIAYRTAFERPHAKVGEQPERIGSSVVWLLPNPSGLNAHYRFQDFRPPVRRVATGNDIAPVHASFRMRSRLPSSPFRTACSCAPP